MNTLFRKMSFKQTLNQLSFLKKTQILIDSLMRRARQPLTGMLSGTFGKLRGLLIIQKALLTQSFLFVFRIVI